MKSAWTRAVLFIVSAFVIIIAVGQIFFSTGSTLKTETAFSYDYDEEIPFTGVFMRDETIVYDDGAGYLSYEHDDGIKVGKSTVIAKRYKNSEDIARSREIEQIKKQIEMLESAEKLIGTDNSQLEAISAQINESHASVVDSILNGNYSDVSKYGNDLLCAMCKREITLKESSGYEEKKNALRQRVSELETLVSGSSQDVFAGGTGYFVSGIDGYEGEIGYSDFDALTEEKINGIIETPSKQPEQNAVGKLVSDYRWRAAAVIEEQKMFGIGEGSEVVVRIGSGSRLLKATVVSEKECGNGKAIYVFECDDLIPETMSSRTASFKLVLKSYGGLRISNSALHNNDKNELGVYIKRENKLYFKKVNVQYWGEDYVICTQETGSDYLKLYDSVVTEGKDLYDGKIV